MHRPRRLFSFSLLAIALLLAAPLSPVAPIHSAAADDADEGIAALVDLLAQVDDAAFHLDILKGINEALKGRRQVVMPKGWPAAYEKLSKSANQQVREESRKLALVFGDEAALKTMRETLLNAQAKPEERAAALESLVNAKAKDLAPALHELVADRAMREAAVNALANYDDPKTPDVILKAYASFTLPQRRAALNTLASRIGYAKRLLTAIDAGDVPRSDVPADVIRRLRLFEDKQIGDAVTKLWGIVRDTPEAKQQRIDELTKLLSAKTDRQPDLQRGRALYAQACAQCHKLFGEGGEIGPDITGSNRANLEYILQNVVDPNALIGQDYQPIQVETDDGQRHLGILAREDASAVTLKTTAGVMIIPKDEIFSRKRSDKSMMPEALLDALSNDQIHDLIAYLASNSQVRMLATGATAAGLFDGQSLTGWDGDPKVWRVEDGVIIGKASGLKENAHLVSRMVAEDFKLTWKMRVNGDGDAGVIVRGDVQADGGVRGYEVSAAKGWNEYEVRAEGSRVVTFVNGKKVDEKEGVDGRGVIAFVLKEGEVRVKDVALVVESLGTARSK